MPFSADQLVEWLSKTKPTQKSVEKITKWVIHYRKYYKEICKTWLTQFKNTPEPTKRLNIIYVINHTIQESKKTNASLSEKFTLHLDEIFEIFGSDPATNSKIAERVCHVFDIWKQRRVLNVVKISKYEDVFLKARGGKSGKNSHKISSTKSSKSTNSRDETDEIPAKRSRMSKKSKKEKKKKSVKNIFEDDSLISKNREANNAIFQAAIQSNSIFEETDWLEKVDEEIAGFSDGYIDKNLVENNNIPGMGINEIPSAKEFTERMTNLLKAPSSLDSEARTQLTKLPTELSDPSKIDKIVDGGLSRKEAREKIISVQEAADSFKNMLVIYNKRLDDELVERKQLGEMHILCELERKKVHKGYIDKLKHVMEREEKVASNLDKINDHYDSMPKSPKFTVDDGEDDADLHEDIRQLFHETTNQLEVNIPSSKYIAHALREK